MTDSSPGFDELAHHFDAASAALGRGDRPAAREALRAAVHDAELDPAASQPLAYALTRLGELALEDGQAEEAEGLFRRALVLAEQALGSEHPDLVVLLNALSRLYLRRAAHDLAEPLLQRLYGIKRAKGEEHPEVATVLASLATVRQALGRHDAAEQLWRRVLDIRERTLAPNHVAIAATLERLAESCAARAKPLEAVQHLQRALAVRELTLGAGHPSVRTLRERIADLQLQATDADDGLGIETPPHPAPVVPSPAMPSVLTSPPWRNTNPTSTPPAPIVAVPLAAASPMPQAPMPQAPMPSARPMASAPAASTALPYAEPPAAVAPAPAFMSAYAPPLPAPMAHASHEYEAPAAARQPTAIIMPGGADGLALQKLLQEIDEQAEAEAMRPSLVGRATTLLREHRGPAIVAGAALLLGAAFTVARARGAGDEFVMTEPSRTAPAPTTDPRVTGTATYGADGVLSSAALAGTQAAATTPTVTPTTERDAAERTATERTPERASERTAERSTTTERAPATPSTTTSATKSAAPAAVPALGALRLDSIARVVSAAGGIAIEDPMARRMTNLTSKPTLDGLGTTGTAANTTQPARLIGAVPVARYPQSLRQSGVQGEVRVSFEVDTLGRPDMRTLVVLKSEHELFTRSVRGTIPEMRFVPAEVGGKKARWLVRMPFVFTVK